MEKRRNLVLPLHIAMIAPERFPLPGSGSVEICILSIARELAKRHAVTIVCRAVPRKGVPVLMRATRIVRRRLKYLVKRYKSPARFAKYIVRIATRPGLAKRLSANCRKTALRKVRWRVTAARLEDIYGAQSILAVFPRSRQYIVEPPIAIGRLPRERRERLSFEAHNS